jgi:hypothetical protein
METQVMLDWIASAPYEELLRKWRHEQPGSPWFKGAVGTAFNKRMQVCRETISIDEAVAISKRVGWIQSINPRDFKDYD